MKSAAPKTLSVLVTAIMCAVMVTSPLLALGGGVGGRPANPDPNNPRTSSIFIYTLKGGDTRDDAVIVANNTKEVQTVELFATDSAVSNTGAFTCKQNVEEVTDVGSWVQLSKKEVTLQPATKEAVAFTVSAPLDADVGEHNGCIVFQPKGDEGVVKGNVRIRTRSAIRMSVTIPGDLRREIAIDSFAITQKDRKLTLDLTIKNSGNVSTDIDGAVTLSTLFGTEVFNNGGGYPVISGKSLGLSFTSDKPQFWGGIYVGSAKVTFDKRAGTFGTSDTPSLTSIYSEKRYVFVTPAPLALATYAMIVLLITSGIGYIFYRRHDRAHTLKGWRNHTVADGETLQSLADSHDITWGKLARLNGIKAPYSLETGTKIKVPKHNQKS